jgi:mannosyl-3-phosphoglycerate phosphatase family protein
LSAGGGVQYLVFTDLDGSLLDHHTYSYQDAIPQLRQLRQLDIPVIPASSKTRVEIERLRTELDNTHPFIAENGAATYIPVGYFHSQPKGTVARDGYWIHELSPPRATWLDVLEKLEGDFPGSFDYFHRAGTEGIMRMTNLPRERAEEANRREYSEPVKWYGDDREREVFLARLAEAGALVLQGGRFLSVGGDCDKGRALAWLKDTYRQAHAAQACHDIAIGDSRNDCAMLEAAETALLIRSTVHEFPALARTEGVFRSGGYGPAGWAEGVARWLHQQQLQDRENRG